MNIHFAGWGGPVQHFRVRPRDQSVKEGASVTLKCEVGEQGGRVQWAKDGFVLGEWGGGSGGAGGKGAVGEGWLCSG